MHVHVSALDALAVFAMVLVIGALWRIVANRLAADDRALGKAMLFVY